MLTNYMFTRCSLQMGEHLALGQRCLRYLCRYSMWKFVVGGCGGANGVGYGGVVVCGEGRRDS